MKKFLWRCVRCGREVYENDKGEFFTEEGWICDHGNFHLPALKSEEVKK